MQINRFVGSLMVAGSLILVSSPAAFAEPASGSASVQPQLPDNLQLDIVGPGDCPNDGIVIGQGIAPETATFTLSVLKKHLWLPLDTKHYKAGDMVNLRPSPRLFTLEDGETATFMLSSPPPADARDDSAQPLVWVKKTLSAPVCGTE